MPPTLGGCQTWLRARLVSTPDPPRWPLCPSCLPLVCRHLSHLRCCFSVATPPHLHQRPIPSRKEALAAVVLLVHPGSAVLRPLGPPPPRCCSAVAADGLLPYRPLSAPTARAWLQSHQPSSDWESPSLHHCLPRLPGVSSLLAWLPLRLFGRKKDVLGVGAAGLLQSP